MRINMIVAAGRDGAIGREGELIWRVPADLKRFKQLTMGHPVIMGRKTWESLPKRPLPGRRNIVVSRDPSFTAPGAEVASSPEAAMSLLTNVPTPVTADPTPVTADLQEMNEPFVMGGEQIYKAFMPMVGRIYLTEIEAECPEADARLDWPLNPEDWVATDVSEVEFTPDGIPYRYVTYERR